MLDSRPGLSVDDDIDNLSSYTADGARANFGFNSLLRRKFFVVSCGLLFLILGAIYGAVRPAAYTASSQLLVYNKELQHGPETVITPGRTDSSLVQNQIEIIQSRNLLLKVVNDLRLSEDEEFVSKSPGLGTQIREWLTAFISGSPESPISSDERSLNAQHAVESIKRRLAVRRVGTSHTISVSFRGADPKRAAQIANQIVNAYLGDQEGVWKAGQSSNPGLRERLMSLGPNARVISEADPPLRPDGPRLIVLLGAATLVGLAFGAAVALLRDLFDRSVRTSEQATALTGAECLGIIPKARVNRGSGAKDVLWVRPLSDVFGFRRLRAALLEQPNLRIIGVTSAVGGEGVTTVAISIARFFAETGNKVLLVDGAFHNFSMSRALPRDCLQKKIVSADRKYSLDNVVKDKDASSFHFLSLGLRRISKADGLWNAQIDNCLRDAAEIYDYIVIDLPPLTVGAEARIAAQAIDTLILVMKWGGTKTETIQGALRSSGKAQLKTIGVILNMTNLKKMRRRGEISWNGSGRFATSATRLDSGLSPDD